MKLLQSHIMTCTCACMERVTYMYMCMYMYGESNIHVHVHVHVWRVCSNPVQANSEWRYFFPTVWFGFMLHIRG